MHSIVQGFGAVVALIGVAIIVFGFSMLSKSPYETMAALIFIGSGFGAIMSGAVLYCFGSIVEHLIAIRKTADRQVAIFDRLGQPKA